MLTQGNLFPEDNQADCMSIAISAENLQVAVRCIRAFYRGLKWAEEFGIRGGYIDNRNFSQVFLIEDDYILGVFDNRNIDLSYAGRIFPDPVNIEELISFYQQGKGNIKTLIVLEKENRILANSEEKGRQSKFLVDVVYPAIEGIRVKFAGGQHLGHWRKALLKSLHTESSSASGHLLQVSLLVDSYTDPRKADLLLRENSPLQLFCMENSPFNLEFDLDESFSADALPEKRG